MFDFINAPTVGQQQIGPSGAVYQYDGTKWVSVAAQVAVPSQGNVGRNFVHNALFNVAQRGAGGWSVSGYTADRWGLYTSLDTSTIYITAPADADRAAIGDEAATSMLQANFTGNAGAAAATSVYQPIEGVRRLAGKTVTLSFWALASLNNSLGISVDQNFGTGGSPSATVNGNGVAVSIAGTWTRYSRTFTLPSAAGKTTGSNRDDRTQLNFWYSSGSGTATRAGIGVQSGSIWLWGVQLEIGSVATPLDYGGTPQQQLAECQRFYQTGSTVLTVANQTSTGVIQASGGFPVMMRATPTMTTSNNSSSNISGFSYGALGPAAYYTIGSSTAAGTTTINASFTASVDL